MNCSKFDKWECPRHRFAARGFELLLIGLLFGTVIWQTKDPAVAAFSFRTPAAEKPAGAFANTSLFASYSGAPNAKLDNQFANRPATATFTSEFVSTNYRHHVHSASVSPLPKGGLIAVWFAGSREGAYDVDIRGARFDPKSQRWGEDFKLISRETTEKLLQRNIRKLGNPVIALAPNNRLWLFYVSVSVGGWAGSAINAMYSDNGGDDWSQPKRLITSPFFNVSTLVRNPPVFHADGSIGLPIYHEFLGKFAEYLYLSPEGRIIDKFRISEGNDTLQPVVVPLTSKSAVALLRNAGEPHGKVLASFTEDSGETWSERRALNPWNPNSAVAAVATDTGILVALNDLPDGRFRLSLYHTDKQLKNWRLVRVLDESPIPTESVNLEAFRAGIQKKFLAVARAPSGPGGYLGRVVEHAQERACSSGGMCEFKYEYPTLIRLDDGRYHVVYSWNNTFIKHATFNQEWLSRQLLETEGQGMPTVHSRVELQP